MSELREKIKEIVIKQGFACDTENYDGKLEPLADAILKAFLDILPEKSDCGCGDNCDFVDDKCWKTFGRNSVIESIKSKLKG